MKRDKAWLTNEIEIMGSETSEKYPHEQMVDREVVLNLIDQLDEQEKVVIPKFVANYIELCKGGNGDRQAYTEDNSELWFALGGDSCGMPNSVSDWLFNEEKVETFARAWLDGYEVEKKKLYRGLDKEGCVLVKKYTGETSKQEIKKALKELRYEAIAMYMNAEDDSYEEIYNDGRSDAYDLALGLIDQLDEPDKMVI